MSELTPASDPGWLYADTEPPAHTRLDCDGCPVAAGDVPDASCAECVVTVFLAAEPWPDGGA
jgi:hypothetical protein